MGSLDREVKERQLAQAQAALDAFVNRWNSEQRPAADLKRDPVYRKLQASVRTARRRIAAIEAKIAHVEAMKAKNTKAEKTESPKAKAAPQPQGGKKKAAPKKKKK